METLSTHAQTPGYRPQVGFPSNPPGREPNFPGSGKHLSAATLNAALRTPASLILGPLQQIFAKTEEVHTRRQAEIAMRNANGLLRTLDQFQIMDQLDQGKAVFRAESRDIVAFLRAHLAHFQQVILQNGLQVALELPTTPLTADFDPELVGHILNNLLSNAIRHTPSGRQIRIQLAPRTDNAECLRIRIQDAGAGMSGDKAAQAFAPTLRAEGTPALGLFIGRQLAELHGGALRLNSIDGLGTEVCLDLPRFQAEVHARRSLRPGTVPGWQLELGALRTDLLVQNAWDHNPGTGNLALLVHPDADMRDFLHFSLEPGFRVAEAKDMASALELAGTLRPDLILSAVELPDTSGFALCQALKADVNLQAAPVILLSRAATADRLRALQAGADACLPQQGDLAELNAQMGGLLRRQRALREHFRHVWATCSPVAEAVSVEDRFLADLREVMAEQLSNENFSVEDLASALAMSRTQLHRKLKAACQQSTSTFMRNFRLEHAYQLLERKAASVSETAFLCGFASASYFSKAFTAKYGCPPKTIRQQQTAQVSQAVIYPQFQQPTNIKISA